MNNEFIYNPSEFNGHSHASTIEEHNGRIFASWYAYKEKEHEQGQIVLSEYDKNEKKWSKGSFIFPQLRGSSCGNPVLFSHNGSLNIFFVILKRNYWDSAELYASSMAEDGSWTQPLKVNTEPGIMIRHRPLIINNQATICAYDEKTMSTILYSFQNEIHAWTEYSSFKGEYIQGDLIATSSKAWQMYLRAAGDNNHVMKALSPDAGKTWDIARETPLYCPLSGIAAIKFDGNKILVCNNHTEKHQRYPLSLSISESLGLRFEKGPFHIDKSEIELSYPTLLEDSDGMIHLCYTYNRKMIKHIMISKEELFERCEVSHA